VHVRFCSLSLYSWYWLIMMGRNYVSELRPPTGVLFIPQVIYEHEEPWWWLRRLGITPDSSFRALWQSYQQTSGVNRRNGRKSEHFANQYMKYLKEFLTCRKILRDGPPASLPIRRKACCWLLSPLKIYCLVRVWTRDPWEQWQAH
jgi:hypothetical protein